MTNECTSFTDHFDDHAEALKRYMRHRLMQHVQGHTGSHWMPPSGNYSLRIALAAAREKINSTMMQHVPTLLAVLMAIAMQGFHKNHKTLPSGTRQRQLFLRFHREKGLELTCWSPITIGV
jgi:hypothetical protein